MAYLPDGSRVILITAPSDAHLPKRLQRLAPDYRVEQWPRPDEVIPPELWCDVEILFTSFTTPLPSPEMAPRLRWIQLYSAGPDPILHHSLFQSPVIFTTASGVHAVNTAEHVFAMLLAWFRHFPRLLELRRQERWPSPAERSSLSVTQELREQTIGIVGYGSIGRQIARLANAFGMRVLAMHRGTDHRDHGFQFPGIGDPEGALPDRYYSSDQLHSMLHESDIVVIAVPLTQQTQGLFDDSAFRAMKPTAFLVNIARGDICDETALIGALADGHIAGAALDVFQQEPLPPQHPLWHFPNVFISPHIAGLTPHYNERIAIIFEENLRRYLSGEPLYNMVDKSQGY